MTKQDYQAEYVLTDAATNATVATLPLREFRRTRPDGEQNKQLMEHSFWHSVGRLAYVAQHFHKSLKQSGADVRIFAKVRDQDRARTTTSQTPLDCYRLQRTGPSRPREPRGGFNHNRPVQQRAYVVVRCGHWPSQSSRTKRGPRRP